jgi:transmembrane 9 superfamily protein 2/4
MVSSQQISTHIKILIFLLSSSSVFTFYLPGLAPVNYCKPSEEAKSCKSDVLLYVNRLNTEESVIPYEYHHFDFCPIDETKSPVENLGQVVFGERIRPGPYKITFLKNLFCQKACTKSYEGGDPESDRKLMILKKGMSLNYQHHWIVDNMPVTWCYPLDNEKQYCSTGFPMGCLVRQRSDGGVDSCSINPAFNKPGYYYIYNHVDLVVTYHSGFSEEWGKRFGANGGRIISVKVTPTSINHPDPDKLNCLSKEPLEIPSSLQRGKKNWILHILIQLRSVKITHPVGHHVGIIFWNQCQIQIFNGLVFLIHW